MGKRKERRLAAITSAGRRVKLDLFAEPSGDLGGSSAQEDVGGDDKSKTHAGLPNSPSTSGQQPENPLSLLGQYSDDDLDEEASKVVRHAGADTSADFSDQEKVAVDKEFEDIIQKPNEDLAALKVEQNNIENVSSSTECMQVVEENGTMDNHATELCLLHTETALTEHSSVSETTDIHVNGDVGSGWKMVLHEESNQYYYWNTLTGETSWEVPVVLAEARVLKFGSSAATEAERADHFVVGLSNSNPILEEKLEDTVTIQPTHSSDVAEMNSKPEEILEIKPVTEVLNEGYTSELPDDKKGGHDVDQQKNLGTISSLNHETSKPVYLSCSSHLENTLVGNRSSTGADSEKYMQNLSDQIEHDSGRDLCSRLLKLGEYLLDRLNSLKGSKGRLIGHDKILKYTIEAESRISDIKSLSSYGSSLLPFWLHSERKLKQLEYAISDEVLQLYESVEMSDLKEIEHKSFESTSEDLRASDYVRVNEEAQKESHNEDENRNDQFTSFENLRPFPDSYAGHDEAHVVAESDEKTPMVAVYPGEDVDMDVEMELDDEILASPTKNATQGSHYYAPLEQLPVWIDPRAEQEAFVSDVSVPPPPDEDWIPPPPPDNEPFPPPPPDDESFPPPPPDNESFPPPPPEEPSELLYPLLPTDAVMAPSFTYAAQYNLSYPGSTLEYYGQTNPEISESNIYAPDPSQLTVSLPQYYYEAVPTTYATTAPVVVNPVEPVSYYGHQDETVPPVPGFTCAESSKLHSASGEESIVSDQVSLDCQTFPNTAAEAFVVNEKTDKESMEASFGLVSDQATANISVTQGNPMSSSPPVTSAVAATAQKVQSKAPRNKKRSTAVVSTLRSNKKVSSMVDKWKAAKEELHEEEDEPENAYEALEKKRQREIEEWRAQQIASGEAKDNANFQPLGGDWRERVKRKRARLISKSIQASLEGITGVKKQPDKDEISRDLPSGWQAYWDESTKQVYYGNSVTAETTWTRPS